MAASRAAPFLCDSGPPWSVTDDDAVDSIGCTDFERPRQWPCAVDTTPMNRVESACGAGTSSIPSESFRGVCENVF